MSYIHGDLSMRQKLSGPQWPTAFYVMNVARTLCLLIITRPAMGSSWRFARWMEDRLPQFPFNARKNRWEAAISMDNYQALVEAETEAKHEPNLSDGVKEWLAEQEGGVR